jgi:hypothetical protein
VNQQLVKEIKVPRYVELDSTCTSGKQEKWLWAFGEYWVKFK